MNKNANIGWLFSKNYYYGLHNGMSDNVQKKNETRNVRVSNCLAPQNEDEKQVIKQFFDGKNNDIINCNVDVINSPNLNVLSFVLETIYPGLLIGTGNIHETGMLGECKLGLQFDYTTGLPYIPGSSVKGLLRSMFPYSIPEKKNGNWVNYRNQRIEYVQEILKDISFTDEDVKDLEFQIFEGVKDGESLSMNNRCIFYDAMISAYNKDILGLDYITPHKNPLKNPIPIQFMKVMPEVKFQFQFRIPNEIVLNSGISISKDIILNLFKTILMEIGIGAKTNVGYGQLVEPTNRRTSSQTPQQNVQSMEKKFEGKLIKIQTTYTLTIKEANFTRTTSDKSLFGKFNYIDIDKKIKKSKGTGIVVIVNAEVKNNKISKIKSVDPL